MVGAVQLKTLLHMSIIRSGRNLSRQSIAKIKSGKLGTEAALRTPFLWGKMADEEFRIVEKEYGKSWVKLLHVKRDGFVHHIREVEVNTKLTLKSEKDYLRGDNSDIIATDSQKNTVYLLAKEHGVACPEKFAVLLCKHFLKQYSWVTVAKVRVEAYPWKRVVVEGREHNHAFMWTPIVKRGTEVTQHRHGSPEVVSFLSGLRVLKTTQSAFENFVSDEYRTLPDAKDRIFSTIVEATWRYHTLNGLCFDSAFKEVVETILQQFAGEPHRGVLSVSVQQTMYETEKAILRRIGQMDWIHMRMPNKHYFPIDFSKFGRMAQGAKDEVFLPVDKPSGMIEAKVARNDFRSRL